MTGHKSRHNAAYRGILFDMDGVILDSMPVHARLWQHAFLEKYGIAVSRDEIYRREGMSGTASILEILREHGVDAPREEEVVSFREWHSSMFEREEVQLFAEVPGMLLYLQGRGVELGLVTGSLRRAVESKVPSELLRLFKAIITHDDVTQGKPDPEPYRKGCELLALDKSQVLAVENAPMGVRSVKAAGITCIAVQTTLGKQHLAGADIVFPDHKSLFDHLKKVI